MKGVRKLGLVVSALLLATASYAAETAQIKVAVVNVQSVLQQSPRVSALGKQLESQFKGRQTKIQDQQNALQAEVDKFKKDSATMNPKDRDAVQKKITNERTDLMNQVNAYQADLQKEQNKIMQGILNDLNSIVSAMAKTQNFSLVLDSQVVVFAADGVDITKDVAKQFNDKKS